MTERWLFPTELTDKKSWLIARNVSAYCLVKHIAEKEHLPGAGQRIYPSTNLIYSFDDLILKIFAPAVCGYQTLKDYNREIYALQQLQNAGLRVPRIISTGCIYDRYNFYYLILERLRIPPASHFIDTCTPHELSRFGGELFNSIIAFKEVRANMNLAKTKTSLSPMLPERLKQLSKYQPCFVHADLSGNNILYDGRHLAVIDFEDWTYGAPSTEYPALVFELLHGERIYIEAFFSKSLTQAFIDEIFDGLICHYNWEQLIKRHCTRGPRPPTSLKEARKMFSL